MAQVQTTQLTTKKRILDKFQTYEDICNSSGIRNSRSMQIRESILSYKDKNEYVDLLLPIEKVWLERIISQGDLNFEKLINSPTRHSSYASSPDTDAIVEEMREALKVNPMRVHEILFKRYFVSLELYTYYKGIIENYFDDFDKYLITQYIPTGENSKSPGVMEGFLEKIKGTHVEKKILSLSPCGIKATLDVFVFNKPIMPGSSFPDKNRG